MIKLWLGNKLRFLSHLGMFLCGLCSLLAPWYIALVIFVLAFVLDYVAFSAVAQYFTADEG